MLVQNSDAIPTTVQMCVRIIICVCCAKTVCWRIHFYTYAMIFVAGMCAVCILSISKRLTDSRKARIFFRWSFIFVFAYSSFKSRREQGKKQWQHFAFWSQTVVRRFVVEIRSGFYSMNHQIEFSVDFSAKTKFDASEWYFLILLTRSTIQPPHLHHFCTHNISMQRTINGYRITEWRLFSPNCKLLEKELQRCFCT